MVDPLEQARIDHETDGHGFIEAMAGWSDADYRVYRRERQRLQPAMGPLPWPRVVVTLLLGGVGAEVSLHLPKRYQTLSAFAVIPLAKFVFEGDSKSREEEARRRGVRRADEGPKWPPDPVAPTLLVTGGVALTRAWHRRRGRFTQWDGASVVAIGLVQALHERWLWRRYPVLRT